MDGNGGCMVIVGFVVLLFISLFIFTDSAEETKQKQEYAATQMRPDIIIEDLKIIKFEPNEHYSDGLKISGRLINHAKCKIENASLLIKFNDCKSKEPYTNCLTIEEKSINLPNVPMEQARDFSREIHPGKIKIKGFLQRTTSLKFYDLSNKCLSRYGK